MEQPLDLRDICRTCEATEELTLVDAIPNLHQLLKTYLNLFPLPQQEAICLSCLKTIQHFHEFCTNSQIVDTNLRSQLKIDEEYNDETLGEVEIFSFDVGSKMETTNLISIIKVEESKIYDSRSSSGISAKPDAPYTVELENPPSFYTARRKLKPKNHKEYQCHSCFRSYSSKENLTQHQKIHENPKESQCRTCKKIFSSKYRLKKHQSMRQKMCNGKVNKKARPRLFCDICKKGFVDKYYLEQHMYFHLNAENLRCMECERVFYCKFYLKKHQRNCNGTLIEEDTEQKMKQFRMSNSDQNYRSRF